MMSGGFTRESFCLLIGYLLYFNLQNLVFATFLDMATYLSGPTGLNPRGLPTTVFLPVFKLKTFLRH